MLFLKPLVFITISEARGRQALRNKGYPWFCQGDKQNAPFDPLSATAVLEAWQAPKALVEDEVATWLDSLD